MATYYVYSGASGSNSGANWANAFTSLANGINGKAAGDIFYVAHDHVETVAGSINIASLARTYNAPNWIICVDRGGSVPPVAADARSTAQITSTGGSIISIYGCIYIEGIIFTSGSSANSAYIYLSSADFTYTKLVNCSLRHGGTGILIIQIGGGTAYWSEAVELVNTTMQFGHASSVISVQNGARLYWRDTPSAISGTIPTTLFNCSTTGSSLHIQCIGVDFSAVNTTLLNTAVNNDYSTLKFQDCKLHASVTKVNAVTYYRNVMEIDFIRCSSSANNYSTYCRRSSGTLTDETTIVRDGGASDGTTPISWKIVTDTNADFASPFETPPIAIWNDTVGDPITVTLEGIWGGGAVPTDGDIWLEVQYLGDATSPQASFASDGKGLYLNTPANQDASTAAWGGSTTKFSLGVELTAAQAGFIYARVRVAKASSTFYIDPQITLGVS